MHQQTGPSLMQIMACCLFSAKPLSEPMQANGCLDLSSWKQVSVKFE